MNLAFTRIYGYAHSLNVVEYFLFQQIFNLTLNTVTATPINRSIRPDSREELPDNGQCLTTKLEYH
jgi:hypothetical protein